LDNIVEALERRASVLQNELNKVHQAIRALGVVVRQSGRKWHHTAATKRKLALAQKKIWDAKRKAAKRTRASN
jgi:hypothetical protein